jgi:hypothetical protein
MFYLISHKKEDLIDDEVYTIEKIYERYDCYEIVKELENKGFKTNFNDLCIGIFNDDSSIDLKKGNLIFTGRKEKYILENDLKICISSQKYKEWFDKNNVHPRGKDIIPKKIFEYIKTFYTELNKKIDINRYHKEMTTESGKLRCYIKIGFYSIELSLVYNESMNRIDSYRVMIINRDTYTSRTNIVKYKPIFKYIMKRGNDNKIALERALKSLNVKKEIANLQRIERDLIDAA